MGTWAHGCQNTQGDKHRAESRTDLETVLKPTQRPRRVGLSNTAGVSSGGGRSEHHQEGLRTNSGYRREQGSLRAAEMKPPVK